MEQQSGMTPYLSTPRMTPEFEAFLFAPIGEEGNGMVLSVLSGLSRLDIDPWDEAARLSQLPRERAVPALAKRIGLLPRGAWQLSDATAIAARLVELLPTRDPGARSAVPASPSNLRAGRKPPATLALWMIAAGIAASLLFGIPARVERMFIGDSFVAPSVSSVAGSPPLR